ncbi:FG-GAP-like repeat-containing protein [Flavobacterium sp. Fl-318]|uniref:FG-GAP-like repeat-containing protein n=1 Tax=Flavobacterium cupriresistens TaxID=2893885 RepID=A0ABU4R581_9FLAO|nr:MULTISPECIES: FG-GAP-like repeat-containing protein [unclassified Flavobacterium]MDX6187737.1 FG-GAP-like repeat-containing protein [Flavobacterium sp. Fl-318]UFH42340.1 FG-GAP-like repeat-containing protein [Flavobacterium sp. F-323]
MKKLYFFLVFFAWSTIMHAQDSQGIPVKGIVPIYRLENEQPAHFTSRSSTVEAQAASVVLVPTGSSTEVGLTAGELSVSLSGAANYQLPIIVPPGINGVKPEISLTYNSLGGLGMAANGWEISGISKIIRIPKTKFHDGANEEVKLTAQDRFALDGQRLILKSGVYGANNSIYETENFSNIKVTMIYSYMPPYEDPVYYFKVDYPDGSKAMYGNSYDSLAASEWGLTLWENAQGIKINYSYNNPAGGYLTIASIKYGSTALATPINEVNFTYSPGERVHENYAGGFKSIKNTVLNRIEVKSNAVGFRNYILDYKVGDRIYKITEKSGDNSKSYNPVVFTYNNTIDNVSFQPVSAKLSVGNITASNAAVVTGDFDDDGRMDCILYPTNGPDSKAKYWLFYDITSGSNLNLGFEHPVGAFENILPTTWLSWNNKMMPQGWTVVKKTDTSYDFKVYSIGLSSIYEQYTRTVNFPTVAVTNSCSGTCKPVTVNKMFPKKILSGDFNGDGLTDILALDTGMGSTDCIYNPARNICMAQASILSSKKVYFVDLKRDNTDNFLKYAGDLLDSASGADIKVVDFNGDGKSDILVFKAGTLKVYSLNELDNIVLLYQTSAIDNTLNGAVLLGDFNGDGKSDFLVAPQTYSSPLWYKYTSTGISFLKETKTFTGVQYPVPNALLSSEFIATDYNNDGKTDLVLINSSNNSANTLGQVNVTCFANNNGEFKTGAGFSVTGASGDQTTLSKGALPIFVSPVQTSSRDNNFSTSTFEIAFVNKDKIHFFASQKDLLKENLITSVATGDGVKESISYVPLNSRYKNTYNSIYNPSAGTANYPYLDITINSNLYVVSKLELQSKDVYRKRLFAYSGAVVNLEGLGFLGFRSVSQSDWHDDTSAIFSTIFINDINLRGANIETFQLPYMYYPYPGATSPADFTSKSIITYNTAADAFSSNKVFKLKVLNSKQFNSIYNTNTELKNISYDGNNNLLSSTLIVSEGANAVQTTTTTITYKDGSAPYIVGRPGTKSETVSHNGTTIVSNEAYTYNSNQLLSNIDRTASGTPTVSELYDYDLFGNIIKKTIKPSLPLLPRSISFQYDTSGRFITQSKDNDDLISTYEYDSNTGMLKKATTPYSSTSYTYDSWFKRLMVKDEILNKAITYGYIKNAEKTIITTTTDVLDGSATEVTFDELGRKIKSGIKDINGSFKFISYGYDIFDRNNKVSEPYFGSAPALWNDIKFDIFSRPTELKLFNQRVITSNYTNLASTITDGAKSKTVTKNAIGNIVSSYENMSGTINYSHFANGNMKQITYNGIGIQIQEDDAWGKTTRLIDPSTGTFAYKNNDFGELEEETSQNGAVLTTITRDSSGRPIKKKVSGGGSNTETSYVYTANKLPLTTTYVDNNETIGKTIVNTYSYDNTYKRLLSVIEEKIGVSKFTRSFTYDALGRVQTETKLAEIGTRSSSVFTKNNYKNGDLYQILDVNNKVLWQTNTLSAKDQILESITGNGIKISNTYDTDGYLSKIQYDKTTSPTSNILTLTTEFDKNTDNVKKRSNNVFSNYTETFDYDAVDRLTTFTNRLGVQESQSYDASGKITVNNLGTYSYDPAKKYQNTSIAINPETTGYYANRQGIFNDSMENRTGWGIEKYPNTAFFSYDNITAGHSAGKNTLKLANTTTTEQYVFSDKWIDINNSLPTQYTYSAWVYSDNPQSEIFLYMKDAANTVTQVNTVNNNKATWTQVIGTFSVPANIKKLRLRLDNNGLGNVWFDDIEIRKTNDPTSQERKLNITYNVFKNPIHIEETNIDKVSFTYNDDNQRATMYYGGFQTDKLQRSIYKHYSSDGSMEIKENRTTNTFEFVTYIGGDGYSAPIAFKNDLVTQKYLYLLRDYQGTILAITDSNGSVLEKRSFDAWGSIIKVQDGSGNILAGLNILDRGYTGHEHLQSVGIINMNARLYDPTLHRFLQADNYIQDPTNTQNFNQYGYVYNNPATFTDRTGNYTDPPTKGVYQNGQEWNDRFGSWIFNDQLQTWIGQKGARNIPVDPFALNPVVIPGVPRSAGNWNGKITETGNYVKFPASFRTIHSPQSNRGVSGVVTLPSAGAVSFEVGAISTAFSFAVAFTAALSMTADTPDISVPYYRAMSASEWNSTHGYLVDRNTSGEGPHVRPSTTYLLNADFIKNRNKYNYIVKYDVYVDKAMAFEASPFIFVAGSKKDGMALKGKPIFNAARNAGLNYIKVEGNMDPDFSLGFPGRSALLFNASFRTPPIIYSRLK